MCAGLGVFGSARAAVVLNHVCRCLFGWASAAVVYSHVCRARFYCFLFSAVAFWSIFFHCITVFFFRCSFKRVSL